ncbi:hypothetical protein [Haladaptatus salinisoli]|uniref:hypothetical protein n=1 Tax=Haladaptatus salinisoli TaxID=2884876 RepID=UPI001D0A0DCD|nr:hypothetical protein [Haladaptatus salinisoli]
MTESEATSGGLTVQRTLDTPDERIHGVRKDSRRGRATAVIGTKATEPETARKESR